MTIQSKIATIGWYNDAQQSGFSDASLHGFVDHLAALGYSGISYRFNVNVSKTGEVLNTYKQDRLDQLISYTQSKGMNVNLVTNWVYDGTQDIVGTGWPSIPSGFDTSRFLSGVSQYFKSAATYAESVHAETFYLGFENYPFVTSEFHNHWATIIADIKSKYHGFVSYLSDTNWWPITNVGIWDLVDKIGVLVNPNMGNSEPTSIQDVEQYYFHNPVDGTNTVKNLIELSRKYDKKLLLEIWFGNFDTVLNGNTDPYYAGNSLAKPLPINLQSAKIAFEGTLDVINKNLSTVTDGFGIGEYDVWVFGDSTGPDPAVVYLMLTWKDYTPWGNPIAEEAISNFLKNNDAYRITDVTNGSLGNDIIILETGNNVVNTLGGKDEIKLGDGSDTVVCAPQPTTIKLDAKLSSWFSINSNSKVDFEVKVNDNTIGVGSVLPSSLNLISSPNGYWSDQVISSFLLPANTELSSVQIVSNSLGILQVNQLTLDGVILTPSPTNSAKGGTGNSMLNWVLNTAPCFFEVLPYIENVSLASSIDGGGGLDVVAYPSSSTDYEISYISIGTNKVKGKIATKQIDFVSNIERIFFTDKSLAYDLNGNAGITAKTLGAVFGKASVSNKDYVGIGLHFLDNLDYSYWDLIQLAINARLGANHTNAQVVDLLYTNVVGKAPDTATRQSYVDLLDNGTFTVASLGVLAADTDFNKTNINLVGLVQTGLEYLPFTG